MLKKSAFRSEIKQIYGKISPFELKDKLISYAKETKVSGTHSLLDAGRGNPNWTAAAPREAYYAFGQFAVEETRKTWNDGDLAGMPQKVGIYNRFKAFIKEHPTTPGIDMLSKIIEHGISFRQFDPDAWLFELTDGMIGDNYPYPDRMLIHIEQVVQDYLVHELGYLTEDENPMKIYAVEGATAAMCYVFDSLIANNIFTKGDKIALMTPIFTPYLEVPHLPRYEFEIVEIQANELDKNGNHTWQFPESELDKLKDPEIKALFVVNPSNPPSTAMKDESIDYIKSIVNDHNPELMIISDDVYGTFVDGFKSLMSAIPYNTIGVYSYSKYYGVTGWRLGTIALHQENIFDHLLSKLDGSKLERSRRRYSPLSVQPDNIQFIDRVVADSRQVALNHTAGLSTPQQVMMAFFSIFSLLSEGKIYKEQTKEICRRRQNLLYEGLGMPVPSNDHDAAYYTQFNLLQWAEQNYNKDFSEYLQANYSPVDVLLRLAEESQIILLSGGGFSGPEWSIRVSLANLKDELYSQIGSVLKLILEQYVEEWKNQL